MKKYCFLVLLISIIAVACKKDKPSGANELILGRWSLLPSTYELYYNGVLSNTSSQQYSAADYSEFKSNGEFQSFINGTIYNNQFRLAGDSLIIDNINKAKITALTANSLSYYYKDSINPLYYRINTFNFKR